MGASFTRAASIAAVIAAAVACGGTAVDQTASGHANEFGGSGGAEGGTTGPGGSSSGGSSSGGVPGGSSGSGGRGGAVGGTGGAYSYVTIEFSVGGAGSYCRHGCVPPSVSISDLSGRTIEHGNWCQIDCSTCTRTVCPLVPCLPDAPVTTITRGWDGIYYTPSTCGPGTSCASRNMVSAGTYVATVCITPGTMTVAPDGSPECVPTGSDVCGSLQFEFPSNGTFKATVGM